MASSGERARVIETMIVRNEEENLPAGLESVRGEFDEIVVVDTSSDDHAAEVAQSFGPRLFAFGRVDRFSAARNEAQPRSCRTTFNFAPPTTN